MGSDRYFGRLLRIGTKMRLWAGAERLAERNVHAQAPVSSSAPAAAGFSLQLGAPVRLGRYTIEQVLAQGAMGTVYCASDTATGARVAIKTVTVDSVASSTQAAIPDRFFREAEAARRLEHPDIVAVREVGQQDHHAYIVMELLGGSDLRVHCRADALLPVEQVLAITARLARALAYAHTQGVIHRDIKPANLMVDLPTDSVKVTDFGIAHTAEGSLTRTGMMLGSPSYMAPEQLLGEPLDGRADLYSLGVVLFEMLTGQLPHQEESISQLMRAIVTDAAPPLARYRPDLPAFVGDVLARALQKDRALRFPDGEQFAEALRDAGEQCSASDAQAAGAPGAVAVRP